MQRQMGEKRMRDGKKERNIRHREGGDPRYVTGGKAGKNLKHRDVFED